jgi:hypothetical protein
MHETNKLRISIWAAYDGDAPLMMVSNGGEAHEASAKELPRFVSGLHREVYSWQTTEDVLGGVVDASRRQALSEALFTAMKPDKPPSERGIEVLARFVTLAVETLANGGTEWSASASSADDDGPRRLNSLLALTSHLQWLAAVHDGQPGISVTAR